jgi:hypothetical protein
MSDPVKELQSKRELFARPLDASGRAWFTRRVVAHVKATNEPDVTAAATARMTKAKGLAEARLATGRKSLVDDLDRATQNEVRTRIVYGALGTFPPVFLEGAGNDPLLDFIVGRRLRSLQRMLSYVNPNDSRAIIGYPPTLTTSQVNKQSKSLWEGVSIDGSKRLYPFVLSAAGRAKPKEAIESLFLKNSRKTDRTLIDCPAAITLVHMDALLAAHDPDKLARALAADRNTYLAIDHPYGSLWLFSTGYLGAFGGFLETQAQAGNDVALKMFSALMGPPPFAVILIDGAGKQEIKVKAVTHEKVKSSINPAADLANRDVTVSANPIVESTVTVERLDRSFAVGAHITHSAIDWFHTVTDDRPDKALFDRTFIPKDDVQPGDHVYLANHPLHSSRISSTPWNGEHSLVVNPWAANPFEMRIIGHGIQAKTVLALTQSMLDECNVFLDVARAMLDKWLALPAAARPDAKFDGKATSAHQQLLAQFLKAADPVPFEGTMQVFNVGALAYRRRGANRVYPASWVMEIEGVLPGGRVARDAGFFFDYDPDATTARPWKDPWLPTNAIAVVRSPALTAVGGPAKRQYTVHYLDPAAGLELLMPLYFPLDPHKGNPVRITFDNLKQSVFFGLKDGKVFVTRPRVAADSGYLAYLKQVGAIA